MAEGGVASEKVEGGVAAAGEELVHNFELEYELKIPIPGPLTLQKYKSKRSGMTTYFVDMDTQVINGYFCFGIEWKIDALPLHS